MGIYEAYKAKKEMLEFTIKCVRMAIEAYDENDISFSEMMMGYTLIPSEHWHNGQDLVNIHAELLKQSVKLL